jgi:hypothetical protein
MDERRLAKAQKLGELVVGLTPRLATAGNGQKMSPPGKGRALEATWWELSDEAAGNSPTFVVPTNAVTDIRMALSPRFGIPFPREF